MIEIFKKFFKKRQVTLSPLNLNLNLKKKCVPVPPFMEKKKHDFMCSCHEHGYFTEKWAYHYSTASIEAEDEIFPFLVKWIEGLTTIPLEVPWVRGYFFQEGCPHGSFGGQFPGLVGEGTTLEEIKEWVQSFDPSNKPSVSGCSECGMWDFGLTCPMCNNKK
jgi:hypothetical protein